MVLAYFINGIGMALLDAQANGYTAALREKAALKMGMIHAVYGAFGYHSL
jgi:fucose permease